MSDVSPLRLDAGPAAELLAGIAQGTDEMLGALDGSAVMLVELRGPGDLAGAPPPALPCIVVGVATTVPDWPAPAGVDVAIGPRGGEPPGWVSVEDIDAEVDRLRDVVGRSPHVAVVLAQTLRVGQHLPVREGLVLESLAYSALQGGPAFRSWLAHRSRRPERLPDPGPAVLVERRGSTLVLTLNRPRVRNAVNTQVRDELAAALAFAAADGSVRAVELRGAGAAFSSGGDLDEFGTVPDTTTGHLVRTARSPARLLAAVASRTTAFVHGACVGAGIELAAFAGRVVAAPDTRLQLPEIGLGLIPGAGGTVSLPRRGGRHRTAWLGLGAGTIDAATARRWGLVDAVSTLQPPG